MTETPEDVIAEVLEGHTLGHGYYAYDISPGEAYSLTQRIMEALKHNRIHVLAADCSDQEIGELLLARGAARREKASQP